MPEQRTWKTLPASSGRWESGYSLFTGVKERRGRRITPRHWDSTYLQFKDSPSYLESDFPSLFPQRWLKCFIQTFFFPKVCLVFFWNFPIFDPKTKLQKSRNPSWFTMSPPFPLPFLTLLHSPSISDKKKLCWFWKIFSFRFFSSNKTQFLTIYVEYTSHFSDFHPSKMCFHPGPWNSKITANLDCVHIWFFTLTKRWKVSLLPLWRPVVLLFAPLKI